MNVRYYVDPETDQRTSTIMVSMSKRSRMFSKLPARTGRDVRDRELPSGEPLPGGTFA